MCVCVCVCVCCVCVCVCLCVIWRHGNWDGLGPGGAVASQRKKGKRSVPILSETDWVSCSNGVVSSVLGLKRPGRDTDHPVRTEINGAQVRENYVYDGQQVVTVYRSNTASGDCVYRSNRASGDNCIPTFRDTLSVRSSWILDPSRWNRFGTEFLIHFSGLGCPETSVRNYHQSLCNDPEERSSYILRCIIKRSTSHYTAFYISQFCALDTAYRHNERTSGQCLQSAD